MNKSIDEYIDVRRAVHFLSLLKESDSKYQTTPIYSTWQMKQLSQTFKAFDHNPIHGNVLATRAYKELYFDQLIVVCNVKPLIGELELKIEKRPRPLLYFKL